MSGRVTLSAATSGRMIGRYGNVPPVTRLDGRAGMSWVAAACTIAALVVPASILTNSTMIAATCALLLIGGLPHGALDLAILRRDAAQRFALVISLYLGLVAVMFATWLAAPTLALALFLVMATAHFAEDWSDAEHPFFALGIAVATLSAPALLHHDAVSELFVLLTGDQAAAGVADALLLVAPVAAACALVAIPLLWIRGHRVTAVNAACAITAMILLPPITGFAIYFCLIHSPAHFRAGLEHLGPSTGIARPTIIATLGGLAIAQAALPFLPVAGPSDRMFMTSFMTLSILTLPHMAVPLIVRRLGLSALR